MSHKQDCCICYENQCIYETNCGHFICLFCILSMKNNKCPICRNKLSYNNNIQKIILNNNSYSNETRLNARKMGFIEGYQWAILTVYKSHILTGLIIGVFSIVVNWFLTNL